MIKIDYSIMDERSYWLGFSVFPGVGPGKFKLLLDHFKSAKEAWDADQSDLKNVIGEKLATELEKFRNSFSIKKYLEKLKEKNVWFLTQTDPEYPQLLLKIDRSPIVLYCKGDIALVGDSSLNNGAEVGHKDFFVPQLSSRSNSKRLHEGIGVRQDANEKNPESSPRLSELCNKTIGIVGTRKITSYGREVTESLTRDLVNAGFTIVSGLALGVDAVAHQTTLESGGKTIAVLGCGVDLCYPNSNKKLYDEIIKGYGAVISEFPIGMTPNVGSFPSRNRIIAGMSQGVLVTEGAEDSGSLITANCALEYNRPVFAVPGPITSSLAKGPNSLISKGAKLVVSSRDILGELDNNLESKIKNSKLNLESRIKKGDTKEENEILEILQNEALHFDEIVRILNMDSAKTGTILTLMEIKGMIKSLENGYFKLIQ